MSRVYLNKRRTSKTTARCLFEEACLSTEVLDTSGEENLILNRVLVADALVCA